MIERGAAELRHTHRIRQAFSAAALPVIELGTVAEIDRHQLATRAGTLIIARRPERGWVSVAEHGTLYVRKDEHYIHPIIGCAARCSYCYAGLTPGD